MIVTIKLYASLARFSPGGLPGTPFIVDISDSATIQDLINKLAIPPEEMKISFVNGLVREPDWILSPGDQVGIFPPIGGG
jgi:sulfur-carrier protein